MAAFRGRPATPPPGAAHYDPTTATVGFFTALRGSRVRRLCLWGVDPDGVAHLARALPSMSSLYGVDVCGVVREAGGAKGQEEKEAVVRGRAATLCLAGECACACARFSRVFIASESTE